MMAVDDRRWEKARTAWTQGMDLGVFLSLVFAPKGSYVEYLGVWMGVSQSGVCFDKVVGSCR